MSVQTKKRMNKKLIVSIVVLALVSVASILGIVTVLALTQRNIDSSIFIRFTAIDIDGEVEAAYRVGNADTWTSMSGETPHVFNASDAETNTQMNPGDITLTSANNFVEFRYTFRNFGDADYTGILTLDEVVTENNMEIQYKYNDSEYSTSSYGLVVEGVDTADSSELKTRGGESYTEMVYYVKVSVKELSKSANYSSDFFWLLERYDGEVSGQVIPMSTSEYVANGDGTYSVRYKGADIDVANVSADTSYKIENIWNIPDNFGSAPVTKVIPGDDLPANTKVVLGNNVTTIAEGTFFNSEYWVGALGLVEIVLGKGITEISENMFSQCSNLRNIALGRNVTSIGNYAFSGCVGLTSVEIPDSVTSIKSYAFYDCTGLTKIIIPNSITNIADCVFINCTGLTTIEISDNVTTIGSDSFNGCKGLTSIVIPDSVTSIGGNAFSNCTGLTSIEIPNSVTSIGGGAFSSCASLTSITIGENVTSIGEGVFDYCLNLLSIEVDESNTTYASEGNCLLNKAKTILIWGCKESVIPDSVTSIGNNAFYGCSGLESVEIPDNVTSIGFYAFCGCSGLESIEIPDNVTSIGALAFCDCDGLKSVKFENSNGWTADETILSPVDLANTSTAATYLTSNYCYNLWVRS